MTSLIAAATGNLTASGTWATVDATSLSDSEAANTALTTSYVTSSTFTPGAITIDGIAVKLAVRAAGSPSNTITVALDQAGSDVAGTPVTINVSDLDPAVLADNDGGWYLFKFSAPVTLAGATAYGVKAKLSATTTAVNLYSTATTNWSRMLRTTTNAAPATGDIMHVIGEHTGAGTGNSFTVTMNETSSTNDYGAGGAADTVAMTIGKRGTLTCGVTAATAYYLRLSGDLNRYSGGATNFGTTGAKMPSDSSFVLEFDPPTADVDYGFKARNGTGAMQGNPITHRASFAADAAANASSFTASVSTGWANNDNIVVASTDATFSHNEVGQVSSTSGATVNVKTFAGTAGALAFAHSGTSPTQAEVIKLDRNVIIRSRSSTLMTYVFLGPAAVEDWDYVEVYRIGSNTANKRGIDINTTTGTVTINDCSIHDCETNGIRVSSASGSGITIQNCDFYNSTSNLLVNVASTGATTFDGLWIICGSANATPVSFADAGCTFTNNVIAGSQSTSLSLTEFAGTLGTWSGNTIHSCGLVGLNIAQVVRGTIGTMSLWRNSIGMDLSQVSGRLILDTPTIRLNTTGLRAVSTGGAGYLEIRGGTIENNTTGILGVAAVSAADLYLFGVTLGSPAANTTADISILGWMRIHAWNTTFASTTEVVMSGSDGSFIRSQKHDGNAALHRTWNRYGSIFNETSIRKTASGYAWKLSPTSATQKLICPGPLWFDGFRTAVVASSLVTVDAWMVKNAAYNGNAPRLVLIGGILPGVGTIGTDVTASMTETQKTITGATNASPIVVTSNSHGYSNGDVVLVEGVVGNTAANARWVVANVAANTFELTGSTGNGAYSSGGTSNRFQKLTATATPSEAGVIEYYIDVDGTAGSVYCDDIVPSQA